jgi:hypothetical protein
VSWYDVTGVRLKGPMIFTLEGHSTPLSPDGGGVLTLDIGNAGAFCVANGSVVKGVRFVGMPPLRNDANIAESLMFMLQAEDSGSFTLVHEDVAVTASERIDVDDGANTAIDAKRVQVFYEPWRGGGTGRTRVHDWAGVP